MNSTYNRQEVQECLIVNMAQVLSREEYAKFKSALEKDNDELLEELIRNANKIRGILK